MSLLTPSIEVKEPQYFHREYNYDLCSKNPKVTGEGNYGLRIAKAALPFVALYKPVGTALSLVMGGCRTISNASQAYYSYSDSQDKSKIAGEVFQTSVCVVTVVCTFFELRLGMLVTTCHDLAMNCIELHRAWKENDSIKAQEVGLQILCNAVYLGLFFTASLEVLVASFALQILVGLYQTSSEFHKGNYLEASAGLLMVAVRMHQITKPVSTLQAKWKVDLESKRAVDVDAIVNCNTAKSEISVSNNTSSPELVNILIKYGNNEEGIPPLHYASMLGDEKAVTLLLNNGASPNALSIQCRPEDYLSPKLTPLRPLDFAAMKGKLNVMEILLHHGAQINVSEVVGVNEPFKWSPALYFAAKHDQGQAVGFLLNKGALLQPSLVWLSPMWIAIEKGATQALDALFDHGINIHSHPNPHRESWLHLAVDHDQTKSIDWLVAHQIDVNWLGVVNGQTALNKAIARRAKDTTVECLLKHGANPNIQDQQSTPLFSLVGYNPYPNYKIFDKAKLLIEHGADINTLDHQQQTVFDYLITRIPHDSSNINDRFETAELLLKKGYNINRKNSQNRTILYLMQQNANEMHKKVCAWLIAHGATL